MHAIARFSRTVPAGLSLLIKAVIVLACFYVAGFGVFDDIYLRVGLLTAALVATFLTAAGRASRGNAVVSLLLGAASLAAFVQYLDVSEQLYVGLYDLTGADIGIAILGILGLLEGTRRVIGLPLALVCLVLIAYAAFGEGLPWILGHGGTDLSRAIEVLWYSFDGVFGRPLAVVVSMVMVFIIFGAILESVGAGRVLLKLALLSTARLKGGPAHAAVVASALFGTMSGSVVGNVVGTGVITMPMIKERGFSPRFAAAIEATASSGGQFMPPVMGAVAFIMADVTGISYLTICLAALVPALFYYASLFAAVAQEARRCNITRLDTSAITISKRDWAVSLAFFLPFCLLLVLLIKGFSPAYAGFWACISALVIGFGLNPEIRRRPVVTLGQILDQAGGSGATILIAVGAVGIIIGIINMTGVGLKFANVVLALSDGSLFLSLLLMMLGCLILGMGMPTVPAYLIIVLVMGPALESMGVSTLITHLFVVYFAVLSSITPPVALAAFAAAPIAGARPMGIAAESVKVGLIGFIIPFFLVYNPSLTLVVDFSLPAFLWAALRLTLMIWLLGALFHAGAVRCIGHLALFAALTFDVLPLQVAATLLIAALLIARRVKRPAFVTHANNNAPQESHR